MVYERKTELVNLLKVEKFHYSFTGQNWEIDSWCYLPNVKRKIGAFVSFRGCPSEAKGHGFESRLVHQLYRKISYLRITDFAVFFFLNPDNKKQYYISMLIMCWLGSVTPFDHFWPREFIDFSIMSLIHWTTQKISSTTRFAFFTASFDKWA